MLFFTLGTLVGHLGSQWLSHKNVFFRVFHSALMVSVDKKCKRLRCCRKNNHTSDESSESFPSPSEMVKILSFLNSLRSRIDIKSLLSRIPTHHHHRHNRPSRPNEVTSSTDFPKLHSTSSSFQTHSNSDPQPHPHPVSNPNSDPHPHPHPRPHPSLRHRVSLRKPLRKPSSHLLTDTTQEHV